MNNTVFLTAAPSRGITRACSGILESVHTKPYTDYVDTASLLVGANFAVDEESEGRRRDLVQAIKLNLIDRKEYPFSLLQRKFNLPIGIRAFLEEKRRFVHILAHLCGFTPQRTAT